MRPFSEMVWEFLSLTVPVAKGVATGKWEEFAATKPTAKSDLLKIWDEQTTQLNDEFPKIPPHRFSETDKAFGQ